MKNYQFHELTQDQLDALLTPDGQERASANLERIANGSVPTKRSPLYSELSPSEVLDNWKTVLAEYALDEVMTPLVAYDLSKESKYGPQGGLSPLDKRMGSLLDYWKLPNNNLIPEDVLDYSILDDMIGEVMNNRSAMRPLTPLTVVDRDKADDKLITASGMPDYGKRNDPAIIARAIADCIGGEWKRYFMILGARSQRGKERDIFIPPFSMNIQEKRFLYPIQDIIREQNLPFFAAYEGFDAVELGFYDLDFWRELTKFVQMDYTSMDKHINDLAAYVYKYVCGSIFQPKYRAEFEETVDHCLSVPVMYSLDKYITGQHGMPSGSGYTNSLETMWSYYVIKVLDKELDIRKQAQALGDDSMYKVHADLTNEQIKEVISSTMASLGYVANPEKQGIDEYTSVYLQRFFDVRLPNVDGLVLGMYPSVLALNTAIFPERYHDPRKWSFEMEILRWIMILENCKNLPYFHDFVQFLMKGDKYKLGLAIPDFFSSLPIIYEESKDIKGFVPTYNQEGLNRGINDFETVKYLKSLSSQDGNHLPPP